MGIFDGVSWRGIDGESKMTDQDWLKRAGDQARADLQCGDPNLSSPDSDGHPTGGMYNGDYTDEYHAACNQRLESDEYYEAKIESDLREIARRETQE
jgi:hypothetical protein